MESLFSHGLGERTEIVAQRPMKPFTMLNGFPAAALALFGRAEQLADTHES